MADQHGHGHAGPNNLLYLIVFVLFVLARLLGSIHVRGGLRFGRRQGLEQTMDDGAMEGALGGLPL